MPQKQVSIMVQKLNNTRCQTERSRSRYYQEFQNVFFFRLATIVILLFVSVSGFSQEDNTKPRKIIDYKNDSSYIDFYELHVKVAKAQINLLKNGGALLVRLKTNANTIAKLKTAGNIDLATQVERETRLRNKNIVRAYLKEFTFCPVYFFNSDCSDSVKHKNLANIFLDSNLTIDPSIICKANFYLIAEQGAIYESSLGIVSESKANTAIERGTPSKEVSIVIKNRYFIQLHKPFPYYQKGYSLKKRYADYVEKINVSLEKYYEKNKGYTISPELSQYVY
jgi:hypothetical protein